MSLGCREDDPLAVGAGLGRVGQEPDAQAADAVHLGLEVGHLEGEVVEAGPAVLEERRDRRVVARGLQELELGRGAGEAVVAVEHRADTPRARRSPSCTGPRTAAVGRARRAPGGRRFRCGRGSWSAGGTRGNSHLADGSHGHALAHARTRRARPRPRGRAVGRRPPGPAADRDGGQPGRRGADAGREGDRVAADGLDGHPVRRPRVRRPPGRDGDGRVQPVVRGPAARRVRTRTATARSRTSRPAPRAR